MCGRYAFYAPREAIERAFGVADAPDVEPRYNVAPTQLVPVVRLDSDGRRALRMQRWGLMPFWARDESAGSRLINARAESLSRNAAFREAFEQRRCLVPVSGFYEWEGKGRTRTPHYFQREDGEPFALAGLWARWRPRAAPADAAPVDSFTIITTTPNELVSPLHDRMPAILPAEAFDEWLDPQQRDPKSLSRWLHRSSPAGYVQSVVSRAVNNARNESPDLIKAV